MKMRNSRSRYMHFGCGLCAPDGWDNFDASPSLVLSKIPCLGRLIRSRLPAWPRNVRYGDITKGLPVAKGFYRGIYSSHVLEHLSLGECRRALVNIRTYLTSGGVFRIVVPDLDALIQAFVSSSDPNRASQFMRSTILGCEEKPSGFVGLLAKAFGHSQHCWLYNFESMKYELETAGFTSIRRARYADSVDEVFRQVEDARRWEGALGIECVAP